MTRGTIKLNINQIVRTGEFNLTGKAEVDQGIEAVQGDMKKFGR